MEKVEVDLQEQTKNTSKGERVVLPTCHHGLLIFFFLVMWLNINQKLCLFER